MENQHYLFNDNVITTFSAEYNFFRV